MLITVAQFKEHFPQYKGTAEDALITTLIGRADALIAGVCGFPRPSAGGSRSLTQQTYVVYPDAPSPRDTRKLNLRIRPVISITSVYVDPLEQYGADTLVSSSDYVLDGTRGELWATPTGAAWWACGGRANKVTLSAGYATTPDDLVAIAAAQVHHLLDLRRVQGKTQTTVANEYTARPDAASMVPPVVTDALGDYVIWDRRVD